MTIDPTKLQPPQGQQQFQINPFAILAAVLFHINDIEPIMLKMDDSEEEKEVQANVVAIEKEDNAVLCILPMEKILKYAQAPYDFKFDVRNGHGILFFEKQYNKTPIYSHNGQQVTSKSIAFQRLLEKLG